MRYINRLFTYFYLLNVDLGWRQQISDLSDLHCTFKHNENNVQFIGRTEFCEENS